MKLLNMYIENDYIMRWHIGHPETLLYRGSMGIRDMLNNENNK